MSRLDELMNELCPDGVIYKEISAVCETLTPSVKVKSKDYLDQGRYPVIDQGQEFVGGYTDEEAAFPKDEYVIFGDHTCVVKYVDFAFAQGADGVKVLRADSNQVLSRYLFHCMANIKIDVSYARHWSKMKTQKIPIPPLEVQREIVRILDEYTEKNEALKAELTAELTARKQQYEHYRGVLLTMDESIPEYPMGEVLTFLNGRAYKREELLDTGKYPVLRVGNFYTNNKWYYSDLELDEDKYCENGDLLYSWAATLGPKIWDGSKCIFHYHIWKILFNQEMLDKEYLYYYLQQDLSEIAKSTTESTMIHVSMKSMKERIIKIPSLQEQKRIAKLISRFDKLCNDITKGLPAEIEARQKQYEHYRDKLLTFKEKEA